MGGNVIKIDAGDRANPTSLAANGDAGTQFQASIGAPVDGESRDPKTASLDVLLDASSGGKSTRAFNMEDTSPQLTVKPVPASMGVR